MVTVVAYDTEEARNSGVKSEGEVFLEADTWEEIDDLRPGDKHLGYFYFDKKLEGYEEAFILLGGDSIDLMTIM